MIQIDGFREIIDRLQKLCAKRSIALNVTPPYTPEPAGKAEKAGRTLNDQARAPCIDFNPPPDIWPFAVESSTYVNNLLPCDANPAFKSPHEMLMGSLNAP